MYGSQHLVTKSKFTLEIIQVEGASVVVDVFTKKSEEEGDGATNMSTSAALSAAGREPFDSSAGTKKLARCRFTAVATGGETEGFVLFRMLPIAWYDAM